MTEEISYYDEDLTELITEIERGIDGLRKLSPVAKNQARSAPKPQRHGTWPEARPFAARPDSSPPGRHPLGSASTSCRAACREPSRCCRRSRWR